MSQSAPDPNFLAFGQAFGHKEVGGAPTHEESRRKVIDMNGIRRFWVVFVTEFHCISLSPCMVKKSCFLLILAADIKEARKVESTG